VTQRVESGQRALLATLSAMSPEDRRAFADRLEARLKGRKGDHDRDGEPRR
jgi:hypothetical protein